MTQPVDAIVAQWAVTPAVRAAGPRLLSVQVAYAAVPVALVETGPGEVELRAHWTAPPELAADPEALNHLATRTTFARAAQLRCTAVGGAIDIAYPVYLEGLTRNKFFDAAAEVAKAAVTIDESVRNSRPASEVDASRPEPVAIDEPEDMPDVAADVTPTAEPQPSAEPQRDPWFEPRKDAEAAPALETTAAIPTPVMYSPPVRDITPQEPIQPAAPREEPVTEPPLQQAPVRQPAPEQAPVQQAPVQQAPVQQAPVQQAPAQQTPVQQAPAQAQAPQWFPTHTVPPGGVPAWAAPDPTQPPVTQLPPGLPVRLAERQGGWARIEAENGWSGWVDGRPLPDPPAS